MFGYVCANERALTKEDREVYQGFYCGVCRALEKFGGETGRLTLNFDMAFLALFLSAVYGTAEPVEWERCVVHPLKKHPRIDNACVEYAAQMNLLLTYYKLLDDARDEKSRKAAVLAGRLKKRALAVPFPRQKQAVQDGLALLAGMEACNEPCSDVPAGAFGSILAELFCMREDEHSRELRAFGFQLGKFIYLMDACCDLKEDLKKEHYNPMVFYSTANFDAILSMTLADCTDVWKQMQVEKHRSIIENVLYSGVWSRYGRNENGKRSV